MDPLTVLAVSGSSRTGSWNRRLLDAAIVAARARGVLVEPFDLASLALPLYHGDIEKNEGVPAGARRLRDALVASDAMLLVTPEYNGFPPPLLINAFDWLSRLGPEEGKPAGLAVTANKPVGLLSASPGPNGGLRALNHTRQFLSLTLQMMPVPAQFALGRAAEAFDENGALKDEKSRAAVDAVIDRLLRVATALKA